MNTSATLSLPEFEVLWEDLRTGPIPYPFDIPTHGATLPERARLKADVHADLERRGLAHRQRPEPELEDALRLLANPGTSITVLGLPDRGGLLRALVAARGRRVVVAVQQDDGVRLDLLREVSPAQAAVGVLPPRPPGPGRAVTVPASALQEQHRTSAHDDVRALQRMLAGPVTGTGHLTARPSGQAVTWIDTPRGRYASVGTDWLTVAPADPAALVRRLSRALAPPAR
ncbi:ESX secretion-associated protein EspG [Saccharothrix syringae]|uniref:ESX secretion-associated protein EspG n=1 Tax=Saccharothrix syringae TaxID=103733 RepID=A0A5Q0GVI6_SACSY|nr:ESX secretion-associated protein EspG [Saccharothrix syringae]QFZ17635.1 ESX secretion-associated protein EspG [Saccharothrix syringae]